MHAQEEYIPMKGIKIIFAAVAFSGIIFGVFSLWGKPKQVSVNIENAQEKNEQSEEIATQAITPEGYAQEMTPQEESVSAPAAIQGEQENTEKKELAAPAKKQEAPAEKPQLIAMDSIKSELISWGFQKASERTIDTIIIHTTYNALGGDPYNYAQVLQEWKSYGVAPHYAIDRAGAIHQLVSDQYIAYHAGESRTPDGRSGVNAFSIGIEVVNTQEGKFSDAEYGALNSLIANLKGKYKIKYVLGHDEIASGRKTDPWGIEWGKVKK